MAPIVKRVATNARVLAAAAYPRAWVLSGQVRGATAHVSILYGGFAEHLSYVTSLVFSGQPEVTALGRLPSWSFRRVAKTTGVDMVFLPTDKRMPTARMREYRFFVPWWVTGEVDTGIDYSRAPWRKKLRDDLRKIRKYDYTRIVSRDPQVVQQYYRTMYMPYVRKAHSYSALPVTLQEVLRMLRGGGELVMTLRDGHAVAGEFIIFDENKAYSRILGIRDGSSELIKHGAVAACYYNTIQHVREKGFDTLHFGGSRPFLQDGLLRYKKKWGLRLTGFDRSGHYLAFPSMSAGAKSFLESNPFIFVRNRELWGGVFGAEVKSDCRQMDSRMHELAIDGLRGIEVFNTANPIEQMFEAPRCVTLASPAIS